MSNSKKLPGVKGRPKVPAWNPETMAKRLHRCTTMLAIHGFLTDAQSRAIHVRINTKHPK